MTVGTELRQARERAGLSPDEVSERTKIQLYKIDALERGNFELLPQGIYLDGIVRAYAKEVGIPQEPLVERVRVERGTLPGDWPVPFAAPIELHPKSDRDILDDSQGSDSLDSFTSERDFAPVHIPRAEQIKHEAPPQIETAMHQTRQRSVMALPLLALLVVLGVGVFLYQLRPALKPDAATVTEESAPRRGSLDNTAIGTSGRRRGGQPDDASGSAVPRDTQGISDTTTPPAHPVSKATPPAAAPNRPAQTGSPAGAAASESHAGSGPVSNVTGAWTLATHVESSSLARFEGLQLGYEMRLEQDGDRVTGVGRKVTENGAGIGRRAQTPVTVSGTIDGDRLMLNFVERGTRRSTQGKFVLLMDESGTLRGRFSSSAARSSGSVEARRLSTP